MKQEEYDKLTELLDILEHDMCSKFNHCENCILYSRNTGLCYTDVIQTRLQDYEYIVVRSEKRCKLR